MLGSFYFVSYRQNKHMPIAKSIWGPALWTFLHSMAYTIKSSNPPDSALKKIVQSLGELMPCSACREHLKNYVNRFKYPTTENAQTWFVDLHNKINMDAGKPTMTHAEARALWLDGKTDRDCGCARKKKASNITFNVFICLMTLVVVVLIIIACVIHRK